MFAAATTGYTFCYRRSSQEAAMFSTATHVPAFDVVEGTVVHAAPCMRCEQPSVARRVTRGEDRYGALVEIALGCWCGTSGVVTMREEHVLTLTGTVALL